MTQRFIGIERDPEYLRMATRRIALAKLGQPLAPFSSHSFTPHHCT
jgi:DNA modification methylase